MPSQFVANTEYKVVTVLKSAEVGSVEVTKPEFVNEANQQVPTGGKSLYITMRGWASLTSNQKVTQSIDGTGTYSRIMEGK